MDEIIRIDRNPFHPPPSGDIAENKSICSNTHKQHPAHKVKTRPQSPLLGRGLGGGHSSNPINLQIQKPTQKGASPAKSPLFRSELGEGSSTYSNTHKRYRAHKVKTRSQSPLLGRGLGGGHSSNPINLQNQKPTQKGASPAKSPLLWRGLGGGFIIFLLPLILIAQQNYRPTWQSLDSRPIPEWFGNAKFGIFIHWGPYSVPAWTPKGTYTEWYQYWLQNKTLFGNGDFKGDEVVNYHNKTYGEDFSYYQFGDMFKADLFKPKDWAKLLKAAGAKYVVLTSKHHDGYTLWPNEQANDRGFPWNSMEVAEKDLVGLLSKAVKDAGLKMGLYYSLYEWYHPWWLNDRERFVNEHFLPQIKDLVQSYGPDILWADGEWDMEADKWKSKEFLAWLFNESRVKNSIVINDRWGKGVRKNHGGYFTTEYEAEAPEFTRPWEECRGMGFSFGYNQNEDAWDYNSVKALTLMLVNIVSTGGNLLLDIGPDARGKIPPIMQDRLLKMGKWLTVNGEAIYSTIPWKGSFQWSEGERNFKPEQHYLGGDFILKQTVDPEPGYAVKELFFTQNEDAYFAISPKWPEKELIIKDFKPVSKSKVTLLATGEELKWQQSGDDVKIAIPVYDPNKMCEEDNYAYVFKITKM